MNAAIAAISTTRLAHEQSLLLQALFGERHDSLLKPRLQGGGAREALLQRGLQVYRANGGALAERALAAAYPVLARLIGDESFAPLARHFWLQQPPQRGDLAQWGAALADFLEAAPQLADEPFLGDVARIEWALHCAATAPDALPDLPSFVLLTSGDPEQTTLSLSPGVALLASAYPVVSIVNAHLLDTPTLTEAADLMRQGVAEYALVWRQGFKPRVRLSSAAEHALLLALQAGLSLENALARACDANNTASAFDFNDWLGQSVQTGLVTGAGLLRNTREQAS